MSEMAVSPNSSGGVLPSRIDAAQAALEAAQDGGQIFVVGDSGTGCTTFSLQLMDRICSNFNWITGSKALAAVPFSTLSVLAAQLSGPPIGTTPTELVTGIGQAARTSVLWILLDRAEFVDEQSAAVLRQFCVTGQIRLLIATSAVRSMPADLQSLVASPNFFRVDLASLTYDDAGAVLAGVLGGVVNSSTITTLLEHSGAQPQDLRELALDALATGALSLQQGYWTLNRSWTPQGKRTADLISRRLSEQPGNVLGTLELLAIIGPIPLEIARKLAGSNIDEAIDADLARVELLSRNPVTGERKERLKLAPGLSSQLIVNSLSKLSLRKHLETIKKKLSWDEFDPDARSQYTRHRLEVGIQVPSGELLSDIEQASQARQFTQVISLTDTLDHSRADSPDQWERLMAARADALYELGMPEAALALLEKLLPEGSAEIRFLSAKIAYAGLGRLEMAEQMLETRPGDPPGIAAYLMLIRSRANKIVDQEKLREYSSMPQLPIENRAAFLAHVFIEMSFAGQAEDAITEYAQLSSSPQWEEWPAAARSELLFSFPAMAFALGLNPAHFHDTSVGAELEHANVDHANVLVSIGMGYLESGMAAQALATLEQAIGLLSVGDRYLVKGYAAALAAYASILIGDKSKAALYLGLYRAEPDVSGQILRPIAERCLVSVLAALGSRQAAEQHLHEQLSRAMSFGRKNLAMRLLLEAWQCGLHTDPAKLSEIAQQVQGPLAKILAGYTEALENPAESNVGPLVTAHLAAGQQLLAAQLAAAASRRARDLGRRKAAAYLFALSIEISQTLGSVNTPALGRALVDDKVLTSREYEICARAAAGSSNLEISSELFLSQRTVEGHLQRAYAKLGVTDRRQLLLGPGTIELGEPPLADRSPARESSAR